MARRREARPHQRGRRLAHSGCNQRSSNTNAVVVTAPASGGIQVSAHALPSNPKPTLAVKYPPQKGGMVVADTAGRRDLRPARLIKIVWSSGEVTQTNGRNRSRSSQLLHLDTCVTVFERYSIDLKSHLGADFLMKAGGSVHGGRGTAARTQ